MGGIFGVASKESCTLELFYGIDYHSHLGTRRGGMAVCGEKGFQRAIHNIENSPFRTKFEEDVEEMEGNLGIGCISDYEPQPLLVQSHLGSFAITTVGKINNMDQLLSYVYENGNTHFQEMSSGKRHGTGGGPDLQKGFHCRGNPLCAGSGGRIHDPASDDKRGLVRGQGPYGPDASRNRQKRKCLLRFF